MEDRIMKNRIIAAAAAILILTGCASSAAHNNTSPAGGWNEPETTLITPAAQEIFDEATGMLIGMDCKAVKLLATEIVNGTNYKFLAVSQPVYPGSMKKTVTITIYQDLEGNVKILDVETDC